MARWMTYIKERYPLPVYILLVSAISLSGFRLFGDQSIAYFRVFYVFICLLIFFAELRLMDELKDLDKDVIAHPDRPLPRGLLTTKEVRSAITLLMLLMLLLAAFGIMFLSLHSGLLFGFTAFYLLLMYKEFYVGDWLSKRPLLYAITHQVILFPVIAFAVSSATPDASFSSPTFLLGLTGLGSFFAYEVCRKLDPDAHPILKTYLSVYGLAGTFIIVLAAVLVSAFSAYLMHWHLFLWPFEALLLLSFVFFLLKPKLFKLVEAMASLSLLVHLSAGLIQYLIK